MATGKEWDEILRDMSEETLKDMKSHLLGLRNIVKFADEWKDTGLFTLINYIDFEFQRREHAGEKSQAKPKMNLCPKHAKAMLEDGDPEDIGEITGRQSCDICKEKDA